MKRLTLLIGAALTTMAVTAPTSWAESEKKAFTTEFGLERCTFSNIGQNPYFVLVPDFILSLEGEENKELVHLTITVLDQTEEVNGVTTRIVLEEETRDGELVEMSWNYFAICEENNSVVYFGEDVDIFEPGQPISHEGAWRTGVDGALPGVIMPGIVLLGSRYFQEIAPDVALDRAEVVDIAPCEVLGEMVENCVETLETTRLEPGAKDTKLYAPEVGLVQDGPLVLVDVQSPF